MNILKKYGFTLLACLTLLYLCLIFRPPQQEIHVPFWDKWTHLILFGGLSCVVFFDNSACWKRPISARRLALGSFLFPVLFGGLIEILQARLTTTRSGDWVDFLADTVGAGLGWWLGWWINRKI